MKHTDELRDIRYEGLEWIKSIGQTVQRNNYELVYTAPLQPSDLKGDTTEQLFYRFNNEHPADYRHPSMSVGDIVAIKRDARYPVITATASALSKFPDSCRTIR